MYKEPWELWQQALRSKKYLQGKHRLRNANNTFCCLGVLSEVAVEKGVITRDDRYSENNPNGYSFYDGEGCFLPATVVQWAGLDSFDPEVRGADGELQALSHLNDSGEYDFDKIADRIQAQLGPKDD